MHERRATTHWILLPDGRWGTPVPGHPEWWELPDPEHYVRFPPEKVLRSGGERAERIIDPDAWLARHAAEADFRNREYDRTHRPPSSTSASHPRGRATARRPAWFVTNHDRAGEVLGDVLGYRDRPHPVWDQMIRERRRRLRAERRCGTLADIHWLGES